MMTSNGAFVREGHRCASGLASPALAGAMRRTTYEEKTLQRWLTVCDDGTQTDLHLPSGSGLELLAYVRAQQLRTNVIVMTGFGAEAIRQQVLAAGAHAFLSNPFGSDALLTLLTPEPSSVPR